MGRERANIKDIRVGYNGVIIDTQRSKHPHCYAPQDSSCQRQQNSMTK